MKFGTLTGLDAKERTAPTRVGRNQVLIQWRMKDAGPTESKRWKNHSAIDRDTAKARVQDYNDYSTQFQYRLKPERKIVDTTVSGDKVNKVL